MYIFIAVISFEKIYPETVLSLVHNTHVLRDSGYKILPYIHSGDCYLDRARNTCATLFLQTDCTDIIYVDSDISFEKDTMLRLLKYDKDIVVGAYPYRSDEKLGFPVILQAGQCKDEETGLAKAQSVTIGMGRIKRSVFERMKDYYKILKDQFDIYSFFDTGQRFLCRGDNTWYGEDNYFCMRWREMGGEMFIAPDMNFTHIGNKKFNGNFLKYIEEKATEAKWQLHPKI